MVGYIALALCFLIIGFLLYKLRQDRKKVQREISSQMTPVTAEAEKMQVIVNGMVAQVRALTEIVELTSDPKVLERLTKMETALKEVRKQDD